MKPTSDVRRGLVASTWEGGFAQAFITWTTGWFLIAFGRRLGADALQLGVLAALPVLAQVVQVGSAYLFETAGHVRRSFTVWVLVVARVLKVVFTERASNLWRQCRAQAAGDCAFLLALRCQRREPPDDRIGAGTRLFGGS